MYTLFKIPERIPCPLWGGVLHGGHSKQTLKDPLVLCSSPLQASWLYWPNCLVDIIYPTMWSPQVLLLQCREDLIYLRVAAWHGALCQMTWWAFPSHDQRPVLQPGCLQIKNKITYLPKRKYVFLLQNFYQDALLDDPTRLYLD